MRLTQVAFFIGCVLGLASIAQAKGGVTIVHDGYTRLIKLQNDGYATLGGF